MPDFYKSAVAEARRVEKQKPKKKPPERASGFFGLVAGQAQERGTPQPQTQPAPEGAHPALLQHGIPSVADLNARVEAVAKAHTATYGFKPTPGLVLSVLRTTLDPVQYPSLFEQNPRTGRAARAAKVGGPGFFGLVAEAGQGRVAEPTPEKPDPVLGEGTAFPDDPSASFLDRSKLALARDAEKTLDKYINAATAGRSLVSAAGSGAREAWATAYKEQALNDPAFAEMDRQKLGLLFDARVAAHLAAEAGSLSGKFLTQVFETMAFFPLGVALMGREVGLDAFDLFRHGDLTPERSARLGVELTKAVYGDVTNPTENPGFLFFDALFLTGIGSAVATGAKMSRAGVAAARRGEGVGGFLREATNKPLPERATVRIPGGEGKVFEQDFLLSNNVFVAAAQKAILRKRERGMNIAREQAVLQASGETAASAVSGGMIDAAKGIRAASQEVYRNLDVSLAHKIGREMRAERRTQLMLDTWLKHELERLAGSSALRSAVLSKLPGTLKKGLTPGEYVALQVETSGTAATWQERLAIERKFHETLIEKYPDVYPAENHTAQLVFLDLAEKALLKPSGRFQKTLDAVRKTGPKDAEIKKFTFTLTDAQEAWRIKMAAEVKTNPEPLARFDRVDQQITKATPGVILPLGKFGKTAEAKRMIEAGDVEGLAKLQKGLAKELEKAAPKDPLRAAYALYKRDAYGEPDMLSFEEFRDRAQAGGVGIREYIEAAKGATAEKINTKLTAMIELLKKRQPLEDAMKQQRADAAERVLHEGAAYIPFISSLHIPAQTQGMRAPGVRPGRFGIPPEENYVPRELRYDFTGRSLTIGDVRVDTAVLVGDQLGATARAAATVDQIRALQPLALDKPPAGDPRGYWPIRKTKEPPEFLRRFLAREEPMLIESELDGLTDVAVAGVKAHYFPGEFNEKLGQWKFADDVDMAEIGWVPEGVVADALAIPRKPEWAGTKLAILINEPFKISAILATPKYLLNFLGNTGMLWFDQGIPRMGYRATRALAMQAAPEKFWGRDILEVMKSQAGIGKAKAYGPEIKGAELLTRVSSKLGAGWSVITDQTLRLASYDWYLSRYRSPEFSQGIRTRADAERFYSSRDAKIRKDRDQIRRLGNKAMVEFDNLTQIERDYLRTMIFVYPWVSRSAVWSVRGVLEHPARVNLLVQLAREAEETMYPDWWDQTVEWIRKRGYVPYGLSNDLNPIVGDFTTVNSFSTLSQLYDVAKSAVWGARYGSLEDILGPAIRTGIHAAEGRDKYGNEYEGSQWLGALREVYEGLPVFGPLKVKEGDPLPPLNPLDRENLIARMKAAATQTALNPSAWGGFMRVLFGGPVPRESNMLAMIGKGWRDQPTDVRLKHEAELIMIRLRTQAKTLGVPLPPEVTRAVRLSNEWTLENARYKMKGGDEAGPKQRVLNLIGMLERKSLMLAEDAAKYREMLAPMKLAEEFEEVSKAIGSGYMDADALADWDSRVGVVQDAAFKSAELQRRLDLLAQSGVIPETLIKDVPQDALWEYGRKVLAFYDEVQELRRQKDERGISEGERAVLEFRIASLEAKADVPVYVNGTALPSPPRIVWGHLTPDDQAKAVRGWATTSWSRLSPIAKELLGRKPATGAQFGWERFAAAQEDVRSRLAKLPPDERGSIDAEYLDTLARYVDRWYAPGFYQDYGFSRQPLAQRLMLGAAEPSGKLMPSLEASPNRETWVEVLKLAAPYAKGITTGASPKTETRAQWKAYVESSLLPWLQKERPGFVKELELYPETLLTGLLDG